MSNPPRILDASGAVAAVVDILAGGTTLTLDLGAARKLISARLKLAATSELASALTPAPLLDSDGFTLGGDGKPVTSNAANSHWLGIDWGAERAITSLLISAPGASGAAPATGARVRVYSAGNWLPLPARDTLGFAGGKASARFPACAASRLMIETLAENKVGANFTGVLVPGAVDLSNVSVAINATPQPCQLTLAVGDEAPFFTLPGPFPAQPMSIDGLLRALNRHLLDHPGATTIPLTLRAAAPAQVKLQDSDFQLEAPPPPAGSGPGTKPPPPPPARDEKPGPGPAGQPTATRGRWCDPQHVAAQSFDGPPDGLGLSAAEFYVRPLAAGGSVRGRLLVHGDDAGRPSAAPLLDPLPWQLAAPSAGAPPGEQWLRCSLPLPAWQPPVRWWAVLQVDAGELLWYQDQLPPAGTGAGLARVGDSAWLPVGGAASDWLQARLSWLAAPARPT